MELEYITNRHGLPSLICHGIRYRKKRLGKSGAMTWVCAVRSCPGSVNIKDGKVMRVSGHRCEASKDRNYAEVEVRVAKALCQAKSRAREESQTSLSQIYSEEFDDLNHLTSTNKTLASRVPTFSSLKRTLERQRQRVVGRSRLTSSLREINDFLQMGDKKGPPPRERAEAFRSIAQETGFPLVAVEKKIATLRSQYFRELSKIQRSRRTARRLADIYAPNWYAFQALSFLGGDDHGKLRFLLTRGPNGQEGAESNNSATPSASSLPSVEAINKPSPQKTSSHDFLWNTLSQTSGEQNTTDVESCHESNRNNSMDFADGFSVTDQMDRSSSTMEVFDYDRPAGVMSDTIKLFGRYVSSILQQLPVTTSYTLQQKFINEALSAKLEYEQANPSRSPQTTSMYPSMQTSGNGCVDGIHTVQLPQKITKSSDVDCSKTSRSKKTKRSKKEDDPLPATCMNEQPLSQAIVKQELLDDFEDHEELEGKTDNSMGSCSRLSISEEEPGQIKQEMQTAFELILCNDLDLEAASESGPNKLMQALRGEVKDKPPESKTPSHCYSSRPLSSNSHPGLNQMQITKRSNEESTNSTRLVLPIPSTAVPPIIYSPDESQQKRQKLSPKRQEDLTEQHFYSKS